MFACPAAPSRSSTSAASIRLIRSGEQRAPSAPERVHGGEIATRDRETELLGEYLRRRFLDLVRPGEPRPGLLVARRDCDDPQPRHSAGVRRNEGQQRGAGQQLERRVQRKRGHGRLGRERVGDHVPDRIGEFTIAQSGELAPVIFLDNCGGVDSAHVSLVHRSPRLFAARPKHPGPMHEA